MTIIDYLVIVIATFLFMEFVAWFTHKYIMHGFLWILHKDHHLQTPGFFQKNDSFFLIFAIPSWLFIMFGAMNNFDFMFFIGIGILLYGIAYFLVHEVLIHKRFKKLRKILFSKIEKSNYLKVLLKAHHMHHKHITKDDGESFGMLIVSKKYYNMVKL
jgi:beta-carotene 3-hydroxylase